MAIGLLKRWERGNRSSLPSEMNVDETGWAVTNLNNSAIVLETVCCLPSTSYILGSFQTSWFNLTICHYSNASTGPEPSFQHGIRKLLQRLSQPLRPRDHKLDTSSPPQKPPPRCFSYDKRRRSWRSNSLTRRTTPTYLPTLGSKPRPRQIRIPTLPTRPKIPLRNRVTSLPPRSHPRILQHPHNLPPLRLSINLARAVFNSMFMPLPLPRILHHIPHKRTRC